MAGPALTPQEELNVLELIELEDLDANDVKKLVGQIQSAKLGVESPLEAGIIAAGSRAVRTGEGLLAIALDLADPSRDLGDIIRGKARAREELLEPIREGFPKSTLAGDIGPTMAVPGTQIRTAATAGAAIGGTDVANDPLVGAGVGALGGGTGQFLFKLGGRALSPFAGPSTLSQTAKDIANRLGFKFSLAKKVKGRALELIEAASRRNPIGQGPTEILDFLNQRALNKSVLKSIGVRAERITEPLLSAARKRLNHRFETIASSVRNVGDDSVDLALDLIGQLESRLTQEGADQLPASQRATAQRLVDDALDALGNADLNGKTLLTASSRLKARARSLHNSQPDMATFAYDVADALDEVLVLNAPARTRAALTKARQQWASWVHLRSPRIVNIGTGNVNPEAVTSRIQSKFTQQLLEGGRAGDPFFDIARLQLEVGRIVPDSGTASGQALEPGGIIGGFVQRPFAEINTMTDDLTQAILGNRLFPAGGRSTQELGKVGRGLGATLPQPEQQ